MESRPNSRPARRPDQRGAALLMAMIILTLVATLASAMVWQQARAVEIETAERARIQSTWILSGAIDWSRIILREDARNGGADHLSEIWATPLAEARLSSFLAADKDNNSEDDGPAVFLSGSIDDAQSRYNLRRLVTQGPTGPVVQPDELQTLQRLFELIGLEASLADSLASSLCDAWGMSATPNVNAPLQPDTLPQLRWLGLDEASIQRMAPYVTVLPQVTAINLNTAPKEVIAAVFKGLDLGSADRLVQRRVTNPFNNLAEAQALMPPSVGQIGSRGDVNTSFFEVHGRLRLGDQVQEEVALMHRRSAQDIVPLWRTRHQLLRGG